MITRDSLIFLITFDFIEDYYIFLKYKDEVLFTIELIGHSTEIKRQLLKGVLCPSQRASILCNFSPKDANCHHADI